MSTNVLIKKFVDSPLPGDSVNSTAWAARNFGQIGRDVKSHFEKNGYITSKTGKEQDLPQHNTEIQTRFKDSTAPWSIGSYPNSDFISTPYNHSYIKEKLKQRHILTHDTQNFDTTEIVNYDDPLIQNTFDREWKDAQDWLKNNSLPVGKTKQFDSFIIEQVSNVSVKIRITDKGIRRFNKRAKNKEVQDKIFEFDPSDHLQSRAKKPTKKRTTTVDQSVLSEWFVEE